MMTMDGCTADCTGVLNGWTCSLENSGDVCEPTCGDGLLRGEEICDDGL